MGIFQTRQISTHSEEPIMSASTVGKELLDLCREGKNLEAIERFYADERQLK